MQQADPVTPSTVSSASSGATPAAAAEDASSAMSAATSFQARLQRASAGGGAQEAAFPAARAALAGSSPLSSSSIVRHVSLSPETPTPGRQQHGFNASPIAQVYAHELLSGCFLALCLHTVGKAEPVPASLVNHSFSILKDVMSVHCLSTEGARSCSSYLLLNCRV